MAEPKRNPLASGIYEVISKAGGVTKLSKELDVSRAAIYIWINRGSVSPQRALQLESKYGVHRSKLMDSRFYALLQDGPKELLDSGAFHYKPKLGKMV